MRVLATITLSASLMIAAPVFAGFESNDAPRTANETVIAKTAPDGTWPFALKTNDTEPVRYFSI
jgi:hypothetical protein